MQHFADCFFIDEVLILLNSGLLIRIFVIMQQKWFVVYTVLLCDYMV